MKSAIVFIIAAITVYMLMMGLIIHWRKQMDQERDATCKGYIERAKTNADSLVVLNGELCAYWRPE